MTAIHKVNEGQLWPPPEVLLAFVLSHLDSLDIATWKRKLLVNGIGCVFNWLGRWSALQLQIGCAPFDLLSTQGWTHVLMNM
jgi:hypothetical protein